MDDLIQFFYCQDRRGLQIDIFIVKYVITVTEFTVLYSC